MAKFSASALTHLLVVSDATASRDWYVKVLDATVYAEYGVTSIVLELLDSWLLLVTGGEPTPDKPTVTFGPPQRPRLPEQRSHLSGGRLPCHLSAPKVAGGGVPGRAGRLGVGGPSVFHGPRRPPLRDKRADREPLVGPTPARVVGIDEYVAHL